MPTDTPAPLPQRAASLSDDDRLLVAHCAELSFPSPTAAPAPPAASAPARGSFQFQVHHASHPYPCAAFAFAPSWSAADWAAPSSAQGARHPFGDAEVDPALFPSLRAVGSGVPARANAAFLDAFRGLLDGSTLQSEVSRAVAEEKRIVFTGHSSGGSIATLAAIWFLEKCTRQGSVNQAHPFCVTFGAPLIGDNIFNHAVRREGWSQCILHFLLPLDIVPRIPLTPLASFREEIQAVLDWLSPQTPNNSPAGRSLIIPEYYETLLRSTLSIASYEACSLGSPSPPPPPHLGARSPRMLPASHPLLYACVFRDTHHLVADLPTDAHDDLPTLAAALVAAAPPHHRHLTHSAAGRAHALLLAPPLALAAVSRAPDLPAAQLLLFLRRLRCLPEDRMRDEMPRLAMRLPLPPDDEAALAREEHDVAAAEAEAEEAARRDADLAARRTPKRDHRGGAAAWAWRRQLWIVILVDLVLLAVLFAAWLAVCRGFSCIGR